MFEKVAQVFRIKELRNKIFFVAIMLVIFRFAAHVPVPGVDTAALRDLVNGNQLFGLYNLFSGGGFTNLSIVMLGVSPYITSSIIMQLLTMVIPALERLAREEGEAGRKRINQVTRWLTIPLAAIQGFGFITLLRSQNVLDADSWWQVAFMVTLVTAGSIFLMWIGELITEKGIGNGISLLIFAGIVAGVPGSLQQTLSVFDATKLFGIIGFGIISLVVIAGVVFITEGQRDIPVTYAKRVRGNKMYGGVSSHLPLRVNQAGVMPIIFAISIMLFPGVIAQFLSNVSIDWLAHGAQQVALIFQNQWFYGVLYFVLVVFFTYFYTSVTFEPTRISENIQKNGGFIPGIRPGHPTIDYLRWIVNRITLTGAIFLGIIAVLPFIVQAATNIQTLTLGGTALLIVVSVVLETVKQIEAQMVMRDYDSF